MSDLTRPEATHHAGLDWDAALARLERLSLQPTEQDAAARLERRTQALAAPERVTAAAPRVELIAFARAGQRYALAVERTQTVVSLRALLAVPGVGDPHLGVMVHDGQLYAIVDPAALVGPPVEAGAAPGFALLMRDEVQSLGIAADAVFGVVRVDASQLGAAPFPSSLVVAVLPGGEHVLSADHVGRNVRLVVDHRHHDGSAA